MANTQTIRLAEPIEDGAGGRIESVTIREPDGALYMALGEPRTFVVTDDAHYFVEHNHLIAAYLGETVLAGGQKADLDALGLADTMRLKAALFDFFDVAGLEAWLHEAASRLTRDASLLSAASGFGEANPVECQAQPESVVRIVLDSGSSLLAKVEEIVRSRRGDTPKRSAAARKKPRRKAR
jgi:hypothetical protein